MANTCFVTMEITNPKYASGGILEKIQSSLRTDVVGNSILLLPGESPASFFDVSLERDFEKLILTCSVQWRLRPEEARTLAVWLDELIPGYEALVLCEESGAKLYEEYLLKEDEVSCRSVPQSLYEWALDPDGHWTAETEDDLRSVLDAIEFTKVKEES